jgi:diaminopimelate epimerase
MSAADAIQFAKLSGSGNDFVCIDARDGQFDALFSGRGALRFAQAVCRRGRGIGADGLIFAVEPEIDGFADLGARFFEPDGSEAELCGNGTGCFVYWASVNQWVGPGEIKVFTPAGVVRGYRTEGHYVRVCIPDPEQTRTDLALTVDGRDWHCDYAVTGVPHLIAYVDDLDTLEVSHWGRLLRHHERFQPRGVNVNFVQVLDVGRIANRTFEFGVEAETLACGTGSAAAAIMTALREDWPAGYANGGEPISITARSGDELRVWFKRHADGSITDVCLETVVRCVYEGALCSDFVDQAVNGDLDWLDRPAAVAPHER